MKTKQISDKKTIERYCRQHAELMAAIENLQEFVATMPAPDENGTLQNVDYGYTGSLDRIHTLVTEAMETADELSGW
jgi:hypothetical protein